MSLETVDDQSSGVMLTVMMDDEDGGADDRGNPFSDALESED